MTEPLISIITPVYNPPREVLARMLDSVRAQTFADWELCAVDDAADASEVWTLLEAAAGDEPRFRVHRAQERGGIVAASNAALGLARGRYIALLDHDDELVPDALAAVTDAIAANPEADFFYSDEDKIDVNGDRFHPFIKPRWSPERLLGQMYTSHLTVYRRALVEEIGGFRDGLDGSQDWDLALRMSERTSRIVRIPEILYHWRSLPSSAASRIDAKPWAHRTSHRAVNDHLQRHDVDAVADEVPGYPGHYWLRPALKTAPLVSIVIPTAGRRGRIEDAERPLVVNAVESVLKRSTYEQIEFVIVADSAMSPEVRNALLELGGERLRIVDYAERFNFSAKVNLGIAESRGPYVLLLNDDIEVLPPGWRPRETDPRIALPEWPLEDASGRRSWIEAMLVYALQPDIGAVGAKLYFPDGALQHAGIALIGGAPHHPFYGLSGSRTGYFGNLLVAGNHLAVTAACMMTSRATLDGVGGFDEALSVNFNDVDFCLRIRERGQRSVCLPWVELLHRESASRGRAAVRSGELDRLRERWGELLYDDPYYDRRFVGANYGLDRAAAFRSYLVRARQLWRGGGPALVAERGYGWVKRHVRERLARRRRATDL